jgi:hypothetical protein
MGKPYAAESCTVLLGFGCAKMVPAGLTEQKEPLGIRVQSAAGAERGAQARE